MLVLFLDDVGLGEADANRNPFVRADLPNLRALLGGHVLTNGTPRFSDHHVSLVPTDACWGAWLSPVGYWAGDHSYRVKCTAPNW